MLYKLYFNFFLFTSLIFCSCIQDASSQGFKVGVIIPLTGNLADYGFAIQAGISLSQKNTDGKKVDFIYEDTAYDAKSAVTAFNKLRLVNKVDLIYVWGVVYCKAVAPLADYYKMPTVGQCIDPESSRGKEYFLRFQSSSTAHMALQSKKLFDRGIRQISLIVSDNSYVMEMERALKENLNKLNILDIQIVSVSENDFRSIIARYKTSNVQAIGVFLLPGQISTFFKQARQNNYNPVFFGTNFFESPGEISSAAGAMKGAVYVANKISPSFTEQLRNQEYAVGQISFAALAHDFASLLNQINSAQNHSGQQLLSELKSIKNGTGQASGAFVVRNSEQEGIDFHFELEEKIL